MDGGGSKSGLKSLNKRSLNFKPILVVTHWTTTNKFARLWFCENIHHSSILKLAIKKAIQKSTNWNLSSKLFEDDSKDENNQFVGFVSSHKKGTLLTSFHIHSFVVFHTDLQKNTIVTYITESHDVKYAGWITSACAIDTIFVMCACFPPSSPITLLEKNFAKVKPLAMAMRQWDLM